MAGRGDGASIRFARKLRKSRIARGLTDRFYRVFYAGRRRARPRTDCRAACSSRILGLLYLVRGVLNRTGLMHARRAFGPDHPLSWEVEATRESAAPTRATVVGAGRAVGSSRATVR
ncbi:MAG: hypothetical protein R2695_20170 [Acidimicrobiales bacterium]